MESLVPTLETCKALKTAGFPQRMLFEYSHDELTPSERFPWPIDWAAYPIIPPENYAAPTAQELADQLPRNIQVAHDLARAQVWWMAAHRDNGAAITAVSEARTMSEALAQLWLKLSAKGKS